MQGLKCAVHVTAPLICTRMYAASLLYNIHQRMEIIQTGLQAPASLSHPSTTQLYNHICSVVRAKSLPRW